MSSPLRERSAVSKNSTTRSRRLAAARPWYHSTFATSTPSTGSAPRLIHNFDALLRASDAGRAIFVTSSVTRGTFAYWGAYAASKAALESMVETYAAELAKTNVRVNLLDPGIARTAMRAEAMPGEDSMSLPHPDAITDKFVDLAVAGCHYSGRRVEA